MPSSSQRQTRRYKVNFSELQHWTEWPTQDEMKAPRLQGSKEPDPSPVDKSEWVETDQMESARKPVIAAYLRGLADELDPPKQKTNYRGMDD
jgi:hypothetical protein